ncbi:MAG TPA: FmdB family zinc ribbon protein [bacterium]|nr:FmdB family zinc ribbon protein [bacterium]
MPVYEYRCTNCDHLFEVTHEVGGTPGPCPVCGGPARRVFTSVGLIFKGSGFHTTDYRKSPASDGADKKDADKKAPEKKPSTGVSSPDVSAKNDSSKASS